MLYLGLLHYGYKYEQRKIVKKKTSKYNILSFVFLSLAENLKEFTSTKCISL